LHTHQVVVHTYVHDASLHDTRIMAVVHAPFSWHTCHVMQQIRLMCRVAVFNKLVPPHTTPLHKSLFFFFSSFFSFFPFFPFLFRFVSFLFLSQHVRTISSLRRSNECTVRRGIQSLPSTTLVQNSCAASATWGSAKPPGGAKAQHLTLQCMTTFTAEEEEEEEEEERSLQASPT